MKADDVVKNKEDMNKLLVYAGAWIAILVLSICIEFGVVPTIVQGFICNDITLSMPDLGGDTIPFSTLVAVTFFVPPIILVIIHYFFDEFEDEGRRKKNQKKYVFGFHNKLYGLLVVFILLYTLTLLIVEFVKILNGSPRPNFFAVCIPNSFNCTGPELVEIINCTSDRSERVHYDSYHSYPSGHSALATYAGFFLMYRIYTSFQKGATRLDDARPLLEYTFIIYKLYFIFYFGTLALIAWCCNCLVTDFRHHTRDVVVGIVIGFSNFCAALGFIQIKRKKEDLNWIKCHSRIRIRRNTLKRDYHLCSLSENDKSDIDSEEDEAIIRRYKYLMKRGVSVPY